MGRAGRWPLDAGCWMLEVLLIGVALGALAGAVACRTMFVAGGLGSEPMEVLPGPFVAERLGFFVASDTGAGFVARLARFSVPSGFEAVPSHSPEPGVAPGTGFLVAGGAGIVAMAGPAVLSVFVKDAPVGLVAVELHPEALVIRGLDQSHVLGVAGVAVACFDDDFVFRVAGSALVEAQSRRTGLDFVGLDVAVTICTLCRFDMKLVWERCLQLARASGQGVCRNSVLVALEAIFFVQDHPRLSFSLLVAFGTLSPFFQVHGVLERDRCLGQFGDGQGSEGSDDDNGDAQWNLSVHRSLLIALAQADED